MISLANGNRHSVTGWWQPQMPLTDARAWGRSRCRKAECPIARKLRDQGSPRDMAIDRGRQVVFSSKDPARIPCRLPAAAGRVAGIWVFIVQCWY